MVSSATVTSRMGRVNRHGTNLLRMNRIAFVPTTPAITAVVTPHAPSLTVMMIRRHLGQATMPWRQQQLPYHLVVGLPALSPTMSSGSLAEWYVQAGDKFSAGDALAKIETDKASMDFEAQDDGYVAKLLMAAGQGQDVNIGTPIMITVEDAEHVPAFADYVLPETTTAAPAAAPTPPARSPPPPPPAAAAAPEPVKAVPPPPAAVVAPPPPPPVAAAPPAPPAAAAPAASLPATVLWGTHVVQASPLAATLSRQQQAYINLYGTTGQKPIQP